MILIVISHQIILIIGDFVLLGGFEPGDEILDIFGVYEKCVECRSDGDFIFYERNESWVEVVMRNAEFPCWEFLGGWRKDLGPPLRYIYWRFCGGGRQ